VPSRPHDAPSFAGGSTARAHRDRPLHKLMRLPDTDIERIAQRVAYLLRTTDTETQSTTHSDTGRHSVRPTRQPPLSPSENTHTAGLVDAKHLAEHLSVDISYVYRHSEQLGAIRVGGPRGRLRFNLQTATDCYTCNQSIPANASPRATYRPSETPRKARMPIHSPKRDGTLRVRPRVPRQRPR
jgi:hypothetical protein